MTTETETIQTAAVSCRTCGTPVVVGDPTIHRIAAQFGILCGPCDEQQRADTTARTLLNSKSMRRRAWRELCPPQFQDTEPHRLPHPSKLQAALLWQYGRRGLILHGPTGKGKSRIAWQLLHREFNAGRSIKFLTHDAGFQYAATYAASTQAASRWVDGLSRCNLLLLDDVFKVRLTDSFEAALFSIVSARDENDLPVVMTSNDVGDTLASRMTADRGPALIRRLRESCDAIAF